VTDAPGAVARAADLARLGLTGHVTTDQLAVIRRALTDDPDARVRAAALGALVRAAPGDAADAWPATTADPSPAVRRRAAELAPALAPATSPATALVALLGDHDVTVVEAAAWALGETSAEGFGVTDPSNGWSSDAKTVHDVVDALARVAVEHRDPLAREAAVAALGAIGDPRGLDAILHACGDRPAVRRRAVLALAPFEGPDVDAAITAALGDRDWQVRQAAEDLSAEESL
jgi:HEAT repeat protein